MEVAEKSGIPIEEAEQLWVELGFPPADRHDRRFTEADAEVLATLRLLRQSRLVPFDEIAGMTRVQALSRVAGAQVQLTTTNAELPSSSAAPDGAEAEAFRAAVTLSVAVNERFIGYAWRRHLVAALRRAFDPRTDEIVGFADLVGYTKLTSRLEESELPALLANFQQKASVPITTEGGQVVKLIGDAVMFVAPNPLSAARAALAVRDALEEDDDAPAVRVGLAMGPLVRFEGDVYGDTVNRASRLAEMARPDTILADDALGTALIDESEITVRPLRPRRLRGIGLVRSWSVRTAPGATD
jgi:adenylate cyclase